MNEGEPTLGEWTQWEQVDRMNLIQMRRKKVYSLRGDMSKNIPNIPFTGFEDDSKLIVPRDSNYFPRYLLCGCTCQQMWIVIFHLKLHNMQICDSQWIILCYVFFIHLLQKVTYYLYFNLIQTHFQSIEYNFQVFFLYSGPVWNIHYHWCNKLVQFNCKQKST